MLEIFPSYLFLSFNENLVHFAKVAYCRVPEIGRYFLKLFCKNFHNLYYDFVGD